MTGGVWPGAVPPSTGTGRHECRARPVAASTSILVIRTTARIMQCEGGRIGESTPVTGPDRPRAAGRPPRRRERPSCSRRRRRARSTCVAPSSGPAQPRRGVEGRPRQHPQDIMPASLAACAACGFRNRDSYRTRNFLAAYTPPEAVSKITDHARGPHPKSGVRAHAHISIRISR